MRTLEVYKDKCNSCGICVLECSPCIIEIKEADGQPSWVEGGDERCMNCGHCVAICPTGAIGLDTMKPEDCVEVERSLFPSSEQIELFIKSRRSIRGYKDESVPGKLLAKLIDIARYAPTGHNSQTLQWLVIEDKKEVNRLAGLVIDWMRVSVQEKSPLADMMRFDIIVRDWDKGIDRIMRGAPHAIVTHANQADFMAQQASPIALTTLELTAYSQDLGACWAGFFHVAAMYYPPMAEALELPEGHVCLGAMMVGYPRHRFARIPHRNEPQIIWR